MYTQDELIDHIRQLEETKVTTIYSIGTRGTNQDGEPFGGIVASYSDINNLPEPPVVMKMAMKQAYDWYVDRANDCCGGAEDCCGPLRTFDEWKTESIDYSVASYVGNLPAQVEASPSPYNAYYGWYRDNYDDSYTEIYISKTEIQDV